MSIAVNRYTVDDNTVADQFDLHLCYCLLHIVHLHIVDIEFVVLEKG